MIRSGNCLPPTQQRAFELSCIFTCHRIRAGITRTLHSSHGAGALRLSLTAFVRNAASTAEHTLDFTARKRTGNRPAVGTTGMEFDLRNFLE